jgi:hypothetical protein
VVAFSKLSWVSPEIFVVLSAAHDTTFPSRLSLLCLELFIFLRLQYKLNRVTALNPFWLYFLTILSMTPYPILPLLEPISLSSTLKLHPAEPSDMKPQHAFLQKHFPYAHHGLAKQKRI